MALIFNVGNFQKEVVDSDIPVLIDFWAEWCPPCKMIGPIIEELASDYEGRVKIGKVDVDSEGELAQRFNVTSIPTLLLFNKGEIVKNQVGALPKPAIEEMLQSYL